MRDMNSVNITGHLGSDFELRDVGNNNVCATASIAIGDSYKDSKGAWVDTVTWQTLKYWNSRAKGIANGDNFRTGDHVYVSNAKLVHNTTGKGEDTRHFHSIEGGEIKRITRPVREEE